MNIQILENGNLQLSLEPTDGDVIDFGYWETMAALFETYSSNGSYQHFDSSIGNPFVGLTSAPCIAESLDCDDLGNVTINGRCWYFANYMIENDLEILINSGKVVYTLIK